MKKIVMGVVATSLLLVGCGQHFSSLSSNPSSITITKYEASNKAIQTTYELKGAKMMALYQAIRTDAKHIVPKNSTFSCPSYSSDMLVWDYHIVIHFSNQSDLSFTQTTMGCTFVHDDQTGAASAGSLPGLDPFQTNSK